MSKETPLETTASQSSVEKRECKNRCEVDDDNPVWDDGYCQSCHDYPEG